MGSHTEKRHLSFSIDSILSHDDHKQSVPKYSPYTLDQPKSTPHHRMPSYGTAALDARMREYTCDTDSVDEEETSHDRENSTQLHSDMELSPDDKNCKSDDSLSISDTLRCKSKKKTRTVFSRQQVFYLEAAFDAKRYLSSAERSEIASSLSLSETQVKVWFQNRRNKWKAQLNGDGKMSPNHTPGPIFIPPFLCGTIAAQAQRGQSNSLPPMPFYRQSMFY